MPVALSVGALLAFWLFVVWDRRRLQRPGQPLSRGQMERGVSPRVTKWPAYLGLSFLAFVLSANELSAPSHSPFTGRWSWLYAASFNLLGEHGVAYVWLATGVVTLLLAFKYWRTGASIKSDNGPYE